MKERLMAEIKLRGNFDQYFNNAKESEMGESPLRCTQE